MYEQLEDTDSWAGVLFPQSNCKQRELKNSVCESTKNSNINWKKAVICSRHWSSGKRETLEDPPDLICSPEYMQRLENSKSSVTNGRKKLVAAKRALVDKKGTAGPKAKRRLLVRTQEEHDSPDAKSLGPTTGCELKENNF